MPLSTKKQNERTTKWLTVSQPIRLIAFGGIIATAFIGFGAAVDFLFSAEQTAITACPELAAGDRFKVTGYSAVYMLNQDKRRLYFPSSEVYHTWFKDFNGIAEIASTCIDSYPPPKYPPYGANYRPGSRLVKLKVSPAVYALEPNNQLAKLESEEVAAKLYGPNWNQLVRDVTDELWPNFISERAPITEAVPHEGMIVKPEGSSQTYYVEQGQLRPIQGDVSTIAGAMVFALASDVFQTLVQTSTTIKHDLLIGNPVRAMSFVSTTVTYDAPLLNPPFSSTSTLPISTSTFPGSPATVTSTATTTSTASPAVPVATPTASTTPSTLPSSPTSVSSTPSTTPSGATPQTTTSTSTTTTPSTTPGTTTTTPTTTTSTPTTTQPVSGSRFSNVNVTKLTDTSITISWNTNESVEGQIKYGTTSAYGSLAYGQSAYGKPASTSHSFTLLGLKQSTTYYYTVGGYFPSAGAHLYDTQKSITTLPTGSGSPSAASYTLTGNVPSHIKTGSGSVYDSKTFNFGTGNIFYSQAKDPMGYLYSSSLTSPALSFANVGDTQPSCPTVSFLPPTYQGIPHVCVVTNAAAYAYTSPYSLSFGDLSSGCYTGHLVFKQNNLYGVMELTNVQSNGSLSYKYWYDTNGGGDFSSLCSTVTSTPAKSPSTPSGATIASDGTWCLDSDGNGSYQTKGNCQDNTGTYTDYCSSNVARDYYCSGTYGSSGLTTVKCADGGYTCTPPLGNACSDGACVTTKDTSVTGPLLTNLSITPTSGPAGTSFTFSATAEDVHGVTNVIFDITYPNGVYILRPNCPFNGAKTGTCVFTDTIDHASSPTQYGTYKIGTVRITDQTGNITTYNQNGTVENGVNATHNFTIPSLTITAPSIPVISSISVTSITNGNATINWTTDMTSDSTVDYGPTAARGTFQSHPALTTSHAVTISGLSSDKIYYFRARSKTSAGGEEISPIFTFRTTGGQCTNDGGSWCSSSDGAGLYGFCTLDKNVLCPKSSEAITKATCTSQGRTWCVPSAGVNPDYGWCQQKGDTSCF